MDHRLGTLQVENVRKSKWFWWFPSLISRGIRGGSMRTRKLFSHHDKCLSHKYQLVPVLHITTKLKSRNKIQIKLLQNHAKWWRVIPLICKCSTTDVLQKKIPIKLSLSCSDFVTLLYLFVSIRSAKVQWSVAIIIRSVHISFVMQQHQLKWKRNKYLVFPPTGVTLLTKTGDTRERLHHLCFERYNKYLTTAVDDSDQHFHFFWCSTQINWK